MQHLKLQRIIQHCQWASQLLPAHYCVRQQRVGHAISVCFTGCAACILQSSSPTSSERHLEDAYRLRITVRWEFPQQVEDDIEDVEDQHSNTKALSHLPLHAHDGSNHCGKHKDQQQDGTGNPLRTLSTKVEWLAFGNALEEPWKWQPDSHIKDVGANGAAHSRITLAVPCNNITGE